MARKGRKLLMGILLAVAGLILYLWLPPALGTPFDARDGIAFLCFSVVLGLVLFLHGSGEATRAE
ncbi:hypothetical protein EU538_06500 [Candidatus Thorarchaeota archaeon]|nr:MAG: hypothetical protein EU538_06500 [Candidatus Thorarchaeota archaeon]